MRHLLFTACVTVFAMSSAVHAEYEKVQSQADFISVVYGKKLSRPLVELESFGEMGLERRLFLPQP
mgnify:CR=1 FL=1